VIAAGPGKPGPASPIHRRKEAASKTKYTCPDCGQNAWARPEANLMCGDCREAMEAEPGED